MLRPLIATRNGVARLHRAMVPPEVALLEASMGVIDTKTLNVVAELGIADLLDEGPKTAEELAATCSADADALHRILRYLVGRGFFAQKRGGRYTNNRRSEL